MNGKSFGKYYADLRVATGKAKVTMLVLIAGWVLFPVAVQSMFHPTHPIGFEYWLQGQPVPRMYTIQQTTAGELKAIASVAILSLFIFGATVLFYRKAAYSVKLWPVPGLLIGIVGNGAWWFHTGFFDSFGALVGGLSLVLMVLCEAVCEHLGQDFVFGKGVRPQRA
jgi:hypothetical protein